MKINQRTFYIFIGILVVLIIGFFGWFVLQQRTTTTGGGEQTGRNFFPFGKPAQTNQPPTTTTKTPPSTTGGEPQVQPQKSTRLEEVWDSPIAGFTLVEKYVPIDPAALSTDEVKTITPTYTFTKTLSIGSTDAEVTELEKSLNACPDTQVAVTGIGSPGKEEKTFSAKTKAALIKFQEKFSADILAPLNRTKGSGTLDTLTRKKLNAPWDCMLRGVPAKTTKRSVIRFVEKGNGNIQDAYTDTLERKRLTNTTIPRIAEAFFLNNGSQVILRYLRDDNQTIDSYLATLPRESWGATASPGTLTGIFLEPNIFDMSISPDGKRLFFLAQFAGGTIGISGNPDGTDRKQVFTSPFMGWLSSWPNSKAVVLTTKATAYAPGYAFSINPTIPTGTPKKVVGPVIGLTTLTSPDMKSVLFSRNTENGPALGIFDVATQTMKDLGVLTLPEKCVWSTDSTTVYCGVPNFIPTNLPIPDAWYQGKVFFGDTLVAINISGILPMRTLADPSTEVGQRIDATSLKLALDNSTLYFVNKTDNILWQLKLQ